MAKNLNSRRIYARDLEQPPELWHRLEKAQERAKRQSKEQGLMET